MSDEEIREILKKASDKCIQETFALGLPITYMDKDGNIVKEYPDGTINKNENIQTKEGKES